MSRQRLMLLAAVFAVALAGDGMLSAQEMAQKSFATPEAAVKALGAAARAGDMDELTSIFGPEAQAVLTSGDPVADRQAREVFTVAFEQHWRLGGTKAGERTLYVGNEDWPLPIPLVKSKGSWRFDTAAGKEEIVYRRIGRNELKVIEICSTFVEAQQEYADQGHDGKPAGLYAQKFRSDEGKQNGLYWPAATGQPPSPLGDLFAEAAGEGYAPQAGKPTPFHGYYFRILTAQGKAAPGGARGYLAEGEMNGGFALVAWPAEYGSSGIMTFLVNQDGVVYENDLREETAQAASAMSEYNPDANWHKVVLPSSSGAKPAVAAKPGK